MDDWNKDESFGAVILFAASLMASFIVGTSTAIGWYAVLVVPIAYPLFGYLAVMAVCQPLIWWAFEKSLDRATRLWIAALWPVATFVCLVVCPASGLIKRIFRDYLFDNNPKF